jgi:hypothetical protein
MVAATLRSLEAREMPQPSCNRLSDDEPNARSGDVFDIDMERYPRCYPHSYPQILS